MSDFSWAPFGPSLGDDDVEPLPPLPPLPGEDEPAASAPPPVELSFDPEELPFEREDVRRSSAPPPPTAAPVNPWAMAPSEAAAAVPDLVPATRPRPKVKGQGDAGRALFWGILGLSILPLLLPSIAAIRIGMRARAAGGGLQGDNATARAAIVLGWIGVSIWALVILVIVGSA